MSEQQEIVQAPAKEFYVYSDGEGINEIRFSNDVQFVLASLLGVITFVAQSMEVPATQLMRDLADIMDKVEVEDQEVGNEQSN